ncbi:DNA translocase FtsK [Halovulum sp. GXIMD14793]
MARARAKSKPARSRRAPLVEQKTEAALRRRGAELIGLALTVLGCAAFITLWTYNPLDPSIFSATDDAPTNALGLLGASLAEPLHRALGWAAYGIPIALVVWGLRLIRHRGEERIVSRIILTPIAIAISAVFAAAHIPPLDWTFGYGLGGMLGDSVLGSLLSFTPLPIRSALVAVTLVLAVAFVFFGLLSLGVNWSEFRNLLRFTRYGIVVAYDGILRLVSGAGKGTVAGARRAKAARTRVDSDSVVLTSADVVEDARAAPKVHRSEITAGPDVPPPDEDRVMARISAAVKARHSAGIPVDDEALLEEELHTPRQDPPLTLGGVSRDEPMDDAEDPILDPTPAPVATPEPRSEPRVQQQRKPVTKSARARRDEQPSLQLEASGEGYDLPPISLLQNPVDIQRAQLSDDALEENARMLESVLDDYGVKGEIVSVRPGPVVTMYELEPAPGLKASRVIGLADDIARSMSALAARVSTVPGRSVIGIELPNDFREKVILREILSAKAYDDKKHALPLALGKDIGGEPVVVNLARMPHLLIAGTTGSGKSVAINTMILSLLYRLTPDECRMIMIDPKMLELSVYDGIPHLLSPVVTDPKKAVVALKWVVAEMEERYRKMSKMGVRNIDGYNSRVQDALDKGEGFTRTVQTGFDDATGEPVFETEEYDPEKMPFIVVIVDEMADLMMVAGKEIEACIQRLAQMARASGIHLIMATQRPSVDVITGTIKANFPTRISFQVTSKIDSRTILGEQGAEQLLGMGDMLYMAGGGRITRVHAPFVSDEEVEEIVNFLKLQGAPDYVSGVVEGPDSEVESNIDQVLGLGGNTNGEDALYDQAVAIVARDRKCSTSYIQRKLAIGYNKAARLVEQMEEQGVVGAANAVGKREILVPEQ